LHFVINKLNWHFVIYKKETAKKIQKLEMFVQPINNKKLFSKYINHY
jgi:hypothetical protein